MKLSFGRWALACLLGCALIAVTLSPGGSGDDALRDYWWRPPIRHRESVMTQRFEQVLVHARLLARNYKAAMDEETAKRVFGTRGDSAADPIVWFAPDVPEFLRRNVSELLASERAARGAWHGHGAVGVLVFTDTATRLDGVPLPSLWDRDSPVMTVVLPATSANGNHCVTVIRLRHGALTNLHTHLTSDRLPLDGCAFTDAFGAPGPKIAGWLTTSRYSRARRLSFEEPRPINKNAYAWSEARDFSSMKCRSGDDSACVGAALGAATREEWLYDYWHDQSVGAPRESEVL
jgi:hypothetical protein